MKNGDDNVYGDDSRKFFFFFFHFIGQVGVLIFFVFFSNIFIVSLI